MRIRFTLLAALAVAALAPHAAAQTIPYATGLDGPLELAQLADGRVLVAEANLGRVSAIADDGTRSDYATGLSAPDALLQLADGRVLVAEESGGAGRVSVIADDGTRADYATGLSTPSGLVQLADGRVLVTEANLGRVSVIADDGTRFDYATGLGLASTALLQLADGRVLVAEEGNGRVSVIADDGTRADYATGLSTPTGLVQLADGRVLVAEGNGGRASVITDDGTRFDYATGLDGPAALLQLPDGRVLVSEFFAGRISVITEEVVEPETPVVVAEGLSGPNGLFASDVVEGAFIVAEFGRGQITVVLPDGSQSSPFTASGPAGLAQTFRNGLAVVERGLGQVQLIEDTPSVITGLTDPVGVVALPDGGIIVTEYTPGRVTRVAGDGTRTMLAEGLEGPYDVSFATDGRLLVTEFIAGRITAIVSDGSTTTFADGLDTPTGIVALADGRVLVVERGAGRVSAVKGDGSKVIVADGLQSPTFIAVSSTGGPAFVSDFPAGQVLTFGQFQPAAPGGGVTAGEDGPDASALALSVWPNPATSQARVAFALDAAADVEVAVYDVTGRRVAVIAEGPHAAGDHEVAVEAGSLAAGVYVVRVRADGAVSARTLTVVR